MHQFAAIDREIEALHRAMQHMEKKIMADYDVMLAKVTRSTTQSDSILALVTSMAEAMKNSSDPRMVTLGEQLDAKSTEVEDAVRANTPAAPPTTF